MQDKKRFAFKSILVILLFKKGEILKKLQLFLLLKMI
jgi:hypothetical protein